MKPFIKRHALLTYFLLAYVISWGCVLAVTGTGRFSGQETPAGRLMVMLVAMLLGPFVGGLLMTAITGGRSGLCDLASRQLHWRVGAWNAALLLNPLLTMAVLAGFAAIVSPVYLPVFSPLGLLFGLLTGFFEETGWTGFATPRLLKRYSPVKTALVLGLLHGGWHVLAGFLGSTPGQERLWAVDMLVFWVGGITAYRVLMTWVYVNTHSLLLGQLMHMVFTGAFATFIPALAYPQVVPVYIAITVGLWGMAGLVIARYGKSLAGRRVEQRAVVA